jgi:hypothetical protein
MKQASAVLVLLTALPIVAARSSRADEPIVLKENGGWCWFQGERAVVADDKLFLTSVASDTRGGCDPGDLVITAYDRATAAVEHHLLHAELDRDDHAVAGLNVLPDGRLLTVYGTHGHDRLQRWRVSESAGDIRRWSDEQVLDVGAKYTYSNVFRLSDENDRIYNFHRGRGFNPNCTISDDLAGSWRYGWRLLEWTREDLKDDRRYTGLDGSRPYVRYASNGRDTIHFLLTDDHPRAYDNSVYHGYYKAGKLHASDGRVLAIAQFAIAQFAIALGDDSSPLKPRDFTEVFRGDSGRVAWAADIRLDRFERPIVAFSVQVDGAETRAERSRGGMDHRYYVGRYDGKRWNVHPMAYAGTRLYPGEDDYTGLVALDPHDPTTVVISTNADPATGAPLISSADGRRHWELFQGTTADRGASWDFSPLTSDSSEDQLRPVIPRWPGGPRAILWTRGTLNSYRDYQLDIVALFQSRPATQP